MNTNLMHLVRKYGAEVQDLDTESDVAVQVDALIQFTIRDAYADIHELYTIMDEIDPHDI